MPKLKAFIIRFNMRQLTVLRIFVFMSLEFFNLKVKYEIHLLLK